jgi:hypothetical protein
MPETNVIDQVIGKIVGAQNPKTEGGDPAPLVDPAKAVDPVPVAAVEPKPAEPAPVDPKKEDTDPAKQKTPEAADPAPTGQENIEDVLAYETRTEEPKKAIPSEPIDINSSIKEKTHGKFESLEDLVAAATKQPEVKFANEQIAKLNELALSGEDLVSWLQVQTADYSKMSDLDVMSLRLQRKYPTMTAEEIRDEIKDAYYTDQDEESAEYKRGQRKLKIDAHEGRTELEKLKAEKSLPKVADSPVGKSEEEAKAKAQKLAQDQAKIWHDQVDASVKDFKKQPFKIGESNFDFEVSEDASKKLSNLLKNPHTLWERYLNEDGTTNMKKLKAEMLILDNWGDVFKSMSDQSRSEGAEAVVKDQNNITLGKRPAAAPSGDPLSIEAQVASHYVKTSGKK